MATGGWDPELLKRLQGPPGSWTCAFCAVKNGPDAEICVACEGERKRPNDSAGSHAPDAKRPKTSGAITDAGFVFNAAPAAAAAAPAGAGFVFGQTAAAAPAAAAAGFVFGQTTPAPAAPAAAAGAGFVFAAPAAAAPAAPVAPTTGFVFGVTPPVPAPPPVFIPPAALVSISGGGGAGGRSTLPGPIEQPPQQLLRAVAPPPPAPVAAPKETLPPPPRGARPAQPFPAATLPQLVPNWDETGAVFVFGTGECSQMGLGEDEVTIERPQVIPELKEGVVRVAAGPLHNAAIDKDGRVWTWGCNDDKALGRSDSEFVPGLVHFKDKDVKIVQASCGDCHSAFLSLDGRVFACGKYKNANGDMGFALNSKIQPEPVQMASLPSHKLKGKKAVQIASGVNHTAALLEDGSVHVWGDGDQGQLGRMFRSRAKDSLTPRDAVHFPQKGRSKPRIVRIFCGEYHCFAIDAEHKVYAWGLNNFGQLGLGHHESPVFTPQLVEGLLGMKVVSIAAGEHFSLALTEDNIVVSFGRAESGQLGLGVKRSKDDPALVPTEATPLYNKGIVSLGCGGSFSLAIPFSTETADLFTFGFGDSYQLGTGKEDDEVTPVPIRLRKKKTTRVLEARGGAQHTIVLAKND